MKVILTGATGMVGEGVLETCLRSAEVEQVLIINRKPAGIRHPKLKEIVHSDLYDLSPLSGELSGYDACFFCLGVSSVGMNADEYYRVTYVLTLSVATTLAARNPGMTFCYVSGAGTDSSQQGRLRWARVKGKTEHDLSKLPFKAAYHFRPAMLKPFKGARRVMAAYKYYGWLFPLVRAISPASFLTLEELGRAMIRVSTVGYARPVLEARDILALAKA